jgi:hypothetical protein
MASECAIIASDTAPVRDALSDGENARLFNFFDPKAMADGVIEAVRKPETVAHLRKAARISAVNHWNRYATCEPQWFKLIDEVLGEVGVQLPTIATKAPPLAPLAQQAPMPAKVSKKSTAKKKG